MPEGVAVVRASTDLAHDVARRIVSQSNPNLDEAAKRLVANGAAHGVDFRLAWVSIDNLGVGKTLRVRQACLVVPGAGRTAMLFLSEPIRTGDWGGASAGRAERAHVVAAARTHLCQEASGQSHPKVVLLQCLPATDERWALDALYDAGFHSVGNLTYMRRAPKATDAKLSLGIDLTNVAWPDGVRVASVRQWGQGADEALLDAMNASYVDTMDCPELCGLRDTRDILTSHRATGLHDPSLWWIITLEGKPHGCALFSPCPDQRSFELVYIGLSPALRGKGLGKTMLKHGIGICSTINPTWSMACAVDERNAPAIKLYESMQFRGFSRRAALVQPVTGVRG